MSSTHSASTSRNLVSVSGFGYRENLALQDEAARLHLLTRDKNLLGPAIMLVRLEGQRLQTSASL